MVAEFTEHQAKERVRTRWTPALDKIFADLVVEQIQLGNRPNSIFDKKIWSYIRDEFNKRTSLNFNNNQLRKHLDVLRIRYTHVKSSLVQNDFIMDDSCCAGFGSWEGMEVNHRPEPVKIKECPIYEQLCIIFADNGADGTYARSSHYEVLEHKSNGNNAIGAPTSEVPSSSKSTVYNAASSEKGKKNTLENKRKRFEVDQSGQHQREMLDSMGKAMLDIIEASKLRSVSSTAMEETSSITNCIKALDEIEGLEETLYFAALDLFDDLFLRETFISLTSIHRRSQWLQEKCISLLMA